MKNGRISRSLKESVLVMKFVVSHGSMIALVNFWIIFYLRPIFKYKFTVLPSFTADLVEHERFSGIHYIVYCEAHSFQFQTSEDLSFNLACCLFRRMTQEVHTAGTSEGHAMSIALRDLWRSYGLSVRVEQHKALLTR